MNDAVSMLPEIRADLRLSPSASTMNGEQRWTIYDPLHHRYISIGRTAYLMLQAWGTEQTPDTLAEEVWQRFSETVEAADAERFAAFLQSSELTVGAKDNGWQPFYAASEKHRRAWASRILHSYLMFRIPLVRPDQFLTRTLPAVRPLASRWVVTLVTMIAFAGLYLVSREWEVFCASVADAFSVQGAALIAAALIFVKVFHELGHSYTAKHFGCRVPVIGVAFILGVPMLYSDVTDAWRLTSRRQRVLIDSAGVLVDLAIASIATFLWAFSPPGVLKSLAFAMASAGWILSLALNLNPFMKFDGYHIFADAAGLDNMQSRAIALARWRLREWLFGLGLSAPEQLPQRPVRLLVGYGMAIWIYRLILFTGIAVAVYHYFFKLAGIVLFAVEIGYFICLPVWSELKVWWSMRAKIIVAPRAVLTATLFAVLSASAVMPWSSRVAIPAVIEADQIARMYPAAAAVVTGVHVKRGQRVQAGDILITLASPTAREELRQIKIKTDILELRLARRTSDTADRDASIVLDQEYASLLERKSGLHHQIQELDLKAPFTGDVVGLASALKPGRWINQSEVLLCLRSKHKARLRGYLAATEAWRVGDGAHGQFIANDLNLPPLDAALRSITKSATSILDQLELAQSFGGPVAASLNGAGEPVPAVTQYAVRADLLSAVPDAYFTKTVPGVLVVHGLPESLIARLWRQVLKVMVRESGL